MAQIAASVATAHEIDGGGWLFQFHFERSHEGILGHHGHTVARAVDLDTDSEFIVSHGGVFLAAAIAMPRDAHINAASRPLSAAPAFQTDNGSPGWNVATPMDDAAAG
jgi:hypothetical protein